jgi:pyruvate,orthophosphate dikinase
MPEKYLYLFSEGKADMKELLGGKGANLAEMTRIGIAVPPGFTITTKACNFYREMKGNFPEGLWIQVQDAVRSLEEQTGKKFGDREKPLLLSVRSGALHSMPGMMDTILNLGLNKETVEGLARTSGNRRFALDCYRRLIQMFSDVVLNVELDLFEKQLLALKRKLGVTLDVELDEAALDELAKAYKEIVREHTGEHFTTDPETQLEMSVKAVFDSWDNPRAETYRQLNDIRTNWERQ